MPVSSFDELRLSPETREAIRAAGWTTPTPIQAEAIPVALEGRDLMGEAHTGTGKTAAFAIPTVERIDPAARDVRAIVLVPTRELCQQVTAEFERIGGRKGIRPVAVYGGSEMARQVRALEEGAQVVVGTPGRVIDHMRRGTLKLEKVEIAVLDEADRMLDMGFYEDILFILRHVPARRQTMLFSATIPPPIEALARRSLNDPVSIDLVGDVKTVERTKHVMIEVAGSGDAARSDALARVLETEELEQGLVFCRTKPATDRAGADLEDRGFRVAVMHGDLSQSARDRALRAFRDGEIELLVATDVASRGLDVLGVSHVINYHVPPTPEDYVHRVGRTARAGRAGTAMTLVGPADLWEIFKVQEGANVEMETREVPTDAEIVSARERRLAERVERLLAAEAEDVPAAAAELVERFREADSKALAVALAAALLEEARRRSPVAKVFVAVGRDRATEDEVAAAVAEAAGIPVSEIRRVDVLERFSYVRLPADAAEDLLARGAEVRIGDRTVRVEPAQAGGGAGRPEGGRGGRDHHRDRGRDRGRRRGARR